MKIENKKGMLTVLGVAIVVAGAWYFYSHTKRFYAKQVVKLGGTSGSIVSLMAFDEGFIKAWAKGLSTGKESFAYQGKAYNTTGGKVV